MAGCVCVCVCVCVCFVEDVFYVVWQSKKITIPFREEITSGNCLLSVC